MPTISIGSPRTASRCRRLVRDANHLADGILAAEQLPRERFVHDRDARRRCGRLFGARELAAADHATGRARGNSRRRSRDAPARAPAREPGSPSDSNRAPVDGSRCTASTTTASRLSTPDIERSRSSTVSNTRRPRASSNPPSVRLDRGPRAIRSYENPGLPVPASSAVRAKIPPAVSIASDSATWPTTSRLRRAEPAARGRAFAARDPSGPRRGRGATAAAPDRGRTRSCSAP